MSKFDDSTRGLRFVMESLEKENAQLRETQQKYANLCNAIPMGLPNGTGFIPCQLDWVKWAKRELGYKEQPHQKLLKKKGRKGL